MLTVSLSITEKRQKEWKSDHAYSKFTVRFNWLIEVTSSTWANRWIDSWNFDEKYIRSSSWRGKWMTNNTEIAIILSWLRSNQEASSLDISLSGLTLTRVVWVSYSEKLEIMGKAKKIKGASGCQTERAKFS